MDDRLTRTPSSLTRLPAKMLFERNHPSLKVMQGILKKYDCIKYAAYRTSSKLRSVQKTLLMDRVSLHVVASVFEKHQLQHIENSVKLNIIEIDSILCDIYFAARKENHIVMEEASVCQLMIALLLNIFDREMKDVISVLSCKIFLALICHAEPREKYHYFFNQLADHNSCLSKKRLQILLRNLISVIEYIGEEVSFGTDLIAGTIESCFSVNNGTLGISEDDFIAWLTRDPQLLVWMSTFYRIEISESVTHNAKCGLCKIYPIVGLRYRCLRCLSYNMCQACFFHGKLNKKHKLKHPVQEYCHPMTTQQSTKAFLLTLKNILYKKNSKLQYLPALRVDSTKLETSDQDTWLTENHDGCSKIIVNGSPSSLNKLPLQELQSIISHLEMESEKLIPRMENLCMNLRNPLGNNNLLQVQNYLINHKYQIEDQVRRLKVLKNQLMNSKKNSEIDDLAASTPVFHGILPKPKNKLFQKELECLSPIRGLRASDAATTIDDESDKKLMWDSYDFKGNNDLEVSWRKVRSDIHNFFDSYPDGNERSRSSMNYIANDRNHGETEICLSTYLERKTFQDSKSSQSGFTWLREEVVNESKENKTPREESEFEDLRSNLMQILAKIQNLPIDQIYEGNPKGNIYDNVNDKIEKVDSLLVDLIEGIEQLIGT